MAPSRLRRFPLVLLYALNVLLLLPGAAAAQGSLLLVGGGSEDYNDWSDAPYRWLVTHAPNRQILVLNYDDTTDFFSGYFPWLSPCTVTNMAITSLAQANDSTVYRKILGCDGIFLRGGDQGQYVALWRHTLTEQAIREVYRRGGVVGGTSAGSMILSEVVYDSRVASTDPRDALRNPLGPSLTFTDDFLSLLPGTLVDSHFFERGRLGRLPAFLARYRQSSGRSVTGIGIEYGTALAVGPDSIGEVMGSGTVTILRFTPETGYTLESGGALSMKNIRFDQLTAGTRFNVATGEVMASPSAVPYDASPYRPPFGTVVLDGSGTSAGWGGSAGSLHDLRTALASPLDTVGIIAPPTGQTLANAVASALAALGTPGTVLAIGSAVMNDTSFAAGLLRCGGIVFVGNSPDTLARCCDSTTTTGKALHSFTLSGKPVAFLGDDAGMAGDAGIGQMYRSIYGAYYGYLKLVPGLRNVNGLQCVSRLYNQSDYIDNRASSVFWSMATRHLPFGLLLDEGTHVTIAGNRIHVIGATPAMLIDARHAAWASVPDFRDPGKANPRQLGGILDGTMHVLRDGEEFDLGTTSGIDVRRDEPGGGTGYRLEQNFPNPFNPSTVIRYHLPVAGSVKLAVYDLLGREVAVLAEGRMDAGMHVAVFAASGCASGVYFYRLQAGDRVEIKKFVVLK